MKDPYIQSLGINRNWQGNFVDEIGINRFWEEMGEDKTKMKYALNEELNTEEIGYAVVSDIFHSNITGQSCYELTTIEEPIGKYLFKESEITLWKTT